MAFIRCYILVELHISAYMYMSASMVVGVFMAVEGKQNKSIF